MAALEDETFSSAPYVFVVGEEKTLYYLNEFAVSNSSPPLGMIMSTIRNRRVEIEDVSQETFRNFCQFVYYGDYKRARIGPAAVSIPGSPVISDPEPPGFIAAQPFRPGRPRLRPYEAYSDGESLNHETALVKIFDTIRFGSPPRGPSVNLCKFVCNGAENEDLTGVLLGHAKIYVFADKWNIPDLQILALHKLTKVLKAFVMWEARRGDFVELARYVAKDGIPSRLRNNVLLFAGIYAKELKGCPKFEQLLAEEKEFAMKFNRLMNTRNYEWIFNGALH